jgi:hypothetical protein
MSQGILIGCAGRARVGKGTFVTLLRQIVNNQTPHVDVEEVAFAFALKNELDPILKERFGISAWTTNDDEKKVIRPYLVARGAGARAEDPDHWVKLIESTVRGHLGCGNVVVVSDVRYLNEANWIHSLGGKVVYIERTLPSGESVPPANEEEAINDPQARAVSDLLIKWPTFLDNPLDNMRPFVLNAWSQLTNP